MPDVESMCDFCWRRGIARVTRRRNTFWRTLFGMPRPSRLVCRDHLYCAASESW